MKRYYGHLEEFSEVEETWILLSTKILVPLALEHCVGEKVCYQTYLFGMWVIYILKVSNQISKDVGRNFDFASNYLKEFR